ncbi:MAG: FAD-dependent oxidoreductase [Myxococcota bacterium]
MRQVRSVSRRQFLTAVGHTAGSNAMLRAAAVLGAGAGAAACDESTVDPFGHSPRPEDWPGDVGRGRTVAILGAGLAGMSAALELTRLGFECTLLEAREAAGGRTRTLRAGDVASEFDAEQTCAFDADPRLYFNAGPSRIPHHHELLLGYCREFGVPLETFTNDNRAARLHDPRQFGGAPQIARRLRADFRGQVAALLATAIDRGALDQELTAADRARLVGALGSFGDLDASARFGGSERAGFPGQDRAGSRERGTSLDPRPLSSWLDDGFWMARVAFTEGLDQQSTMLQPVGGMDQIAKAFQTQIEPSLTLGAVITALRKRSEGVTVEYEQAGAARELQADFGLVTLPAPVLAGLTTDFSAEARREIGGFQYTSAVRIAFQAPRFWERNHNIYGGISWTNQAITQIWYPNHDFGAEQGVVLGAYSFGGAAGDGLTAQPPPQRLTTAVNQASAVHPEFATEASRGISVAWKNVPFQRGGWGVSTPDVLLQPDDRYYFAGEHLSRLQGWQEGAILSAYRAVDGIVSAVSS